jgi:hypothetical protein
VNISTALLPTTVPVLLDILRDIPYIDFDMNLTWDGELLARSRQMNIRVKILARLVFTRPINLHDGLRSFEAFRGPFGIQGGRHDRYNDLHICPGQQTAR